MKNAYQLPDGRILDLPAHCTADREPFTLSCFPLHVVEAVRVPGLVEAPRVTFGRTYVERWVKGSDGYRRVRRLRSAGITVATRTQHDSRRLWNELGANRVSVEVTELVYVLPSHMAAPIPVVPAVAATVAA